MRLCFLLPLVIAAPMLRGAPPVDFTRDIRPLQIAGDLLPGATQDQRVATGFLRNGMVNEEGAILAEQFRIEGVIDRIDCIGKSVLGLSLNCTQGHDHKFDPIAHPDILPDGSVLSLGHKNFSQMLTMFFVENKGSPE